MNSLQPILATISPNFLPKTLFHNESDMDETNGKPVVFFKKMSSWYFARILSNASVKHGSFWTQIRNYLNRWVGCIIRILLCVWPQCMPDWFREYSIKVRMMLFCFKFVFWSIAEFLLSLAWLLFQTPILEKHPFYIFCWHEGRLFPAY